MLSCTLKTFFWSVCNLNIKERRNLQTSVDKFSSQMELRVSHAYNIWRWLRFSILFIIQFPGFRSAGQNTQALWVAYTNNICS